MFGEEKQTASKTSPISYYLKWTGYKKVKDTIVKDGKEKEVISYDPFHRMEFWDKESNGNMNVVPESFIVLDDRVSSVTGYNKAKACGIISNYVKNSAKEEFVVKLQTDGYPELSKGLWSEIKPFVTSCGGKFTKNLLVMESGLINNYQFSGKSLNTINEDLEKIDTNNYMVEFDKFDDYPDGEIPYSIPRFKQGREITKEQRNEAMGLVEKLKEYFTS